MARCPAHEDKQNSLAVSTGKDGRILLMCHAGCNLEQIVAALGLTVRDLYPEKKAPVGREAEYIYHDANGDPLLKKVKMRKADGSKFFFWQHMDGGQWKDKRGGIDPPLYNVQALTGETAAFIVEGEKDVDTMKALGFPAVSLPDGAGGKWQDRYAAPFRGLDVYIIPDNDEPGRKYADMVAGHLQGVAKAVHVLNLERAWPEIQPKEDVSDMVQWLGAEKARQALAELEEVSEEWRAGVDDPFLACFKTLDEFTEEEASWLVPGWIPEGQITVVAADGGVGKTTFWCNIVAALSSGKPCILDPPGYHREPMKVAFCTTEDSVKKKLHKKLREAGANMKNIITLDFSSDSEGALKNFKFGSPDMQRYVKYFKPAVSVFDPVQGFVPPDINMGSRNAMRDCMAPLISWGEEVGTTFLVICHTNKRKGAYGRDRIADSADLWDIARSVIMAGTTPDSDVRYLSNEKNNYSRLQETVLFSINDREQIEKVGTTGKRDREFILESAVINGKPKMEDCKEWILRYLEDNGGDVFTKDLDDAAIAAGHAKKTVRNAKDALSGKDGKGDPVRIRYYQTGSEKGNVWRTALIDIAGSPFTEVSSDDPLPF
jgi:5S rRNA maturation endonuclease (ribonuclease M5)